MSELSLVSTKHCHVQLFLCLTILEKIIGILSTTSGYASIIINVVTDNHLCIVEHEASTF